MSTQAAKLHPAIERIKPRADWKTVGHRVSDNISGRYGLYVEALWNSYERGQAKHIWVQVSGRGKHYTVEIKDDGIGLNAMRRERFMCFGITDEDETGRNYQGLGSKRMSRDFTTCEIWTVSDDVPAGKMSYTKFEWDDLWEIWEKKEGSVNFILQSFDADKMGLPAGKTGTRILVSGARECNPRFLPETIRNNLTDDIPPEIQEITFVNGQPMPSRAIVGKPVRLDIRDPELGLLQYRFYIPKYKSREDEMWIGPYERTCTWRQFHTEVDEETRRDRLDIMLEGVYGEIRAEFLRRWVRTDRKGFEQALYEHRHIDRFYDVTEREVVPELERQMGLIKTAELDKKDERILDQLRDYASALAEVERTEEVPRAKAPLKLSLTEVRCVKGSKKPTQVEVIARDPELTLHWEVSNSGGRVNIKDEGVTLEYWPGVLTGRYQLTCSYEEQPETRAHFTPTIVSEKKLWVDPERVTVAPGQQVELLACNVEDCTSGAENLVWRLSSEDTEGRFVVRYKDRQSVATKARGERVWYRAGSVLDTFRVEVYDNSSRQTIAFSDITVQTPVKRTREDTATPPDVVEIEGIQYRINFEDMGGFPKPSKLIPSGKRCEFVIHKTHPVCKHTRRLRGDEGFLELALNQLLIQHVSYSSGRRGERLTSEETRDRMNDLYTKMAERIEARS